MNAFWKWLILLSTVTNFSFCRLEDHFKRIEKKEHYHSIRNIDFIYMINLDRRPERFQRSFEQLSKYNIYPYRFSAIDGKKDLSLEDINDMGVKFDPKKMESGFWASYYLPNGNVLLEKINKKDRVYFYGECNGTFNKVLGKGGMGCALSHLSILQDAWDSGYNTIWVMEDDIEIIKDPRIISELIDELNYLVGYENWDILFTDVDFRAYDSKEGWKYTTCSSSCKRPNFNPSTHNDYSLKQSINANFRRIGSRYGTHSMIIRRSAMKKILDFEKKYNIYLPIDMDIFLPTGINCYTVIEDIVTNIIGKDSDIQNEGG